MKEQTTKDVYIGIDLGGTAIKMGICSSQGKIIGDFQKPTPKDRNYLTLLSVMVEMVQELLDQTGAPRESLRGVGIGVPALLNVRTGFVYEMVNLGMKNIAFKQELEQALQLPCFLDNDANTAAAGEKWLGAGRGSQHVFCITLGTGIGGGLILGGNIYHGSDGLAGEIGHVVVRPETGRQCACGNIGCLETEASASAVEFYGTEVAKQGKTLLTEIWKRTGNVTAQDVFQTSQKGDKKSQGIVDQAAYYMGLTLAQVSTILYPEKIIIGGGMSQAGEALLQPIRSYFMKYTLSQISKTVKIVPAELGNRAGWLGAAWLVHIDRYSNDGILGD